MPATLRKPVYSSPVSSWSHCSRLHFLSLPTAALDVRLNLSKLQQAKFKCGTSWCIKPTNSYCCSPDCCTRMFFSPSWKRCTSNRVKRPLRSTASPAPPTQTGHADNGRWDKPGVSLGAFGTSRSTCCLFSKGQAQGVFPASLLTWKCHSFVHRGNGIRVNAA